MLRTFDGTEPDIAESAYVDSSAVVIGDVRVGPNASILPSAVLRADLGMIELREGANVQDNVTIHADTPDQQVLIEEYGAVGHNAIVHNARVGERSLVGMNAVVLDDVQLEPYSVVAAGSVVLEGETVPSRTLVGGSPASVLKEQLDEDSQWFQTGEHYAALADRHAKSTVVEEK